jgi:CheY-like chemotaxis protein
MSKKILLADDSVTIQKVISITFASEDYDLVTVSDGDEAVEKARELRPDLVMADVAMPGRNGYEVCEAIKNDPGLGNIPVILLAGTFEPLNDEEASRVKADDSIVKPFESQELLEKVSGLLEAAPGAAGAEEAIPGLGVAEEGWDGGDFPGLDESFEEKAPGEAPEPSSDVGFLEGGMFEAPKEDFSQKASAEYVDLDLTEEELKPAPEAQAPTEPAPPELDFSGMTDFSAEPTKEEPVEEGPAGIEPEPAPEAGPEPAFGEPEPVKEEPVKPESVKEEASAFSTEEAFELEDFGPGEFGEIEEEAAPEAAEPETTQEETVWAQEDLIEVPEERPHEPEPEGFGIVEEASEAQPAGEPVGEAREPEAFIEDVLEPEPEFSDVIERAAEEVAESIKERATEEVAESIKDSVELPKEQVEEIVARVAREVVEKIAWDVVPDLAEELIVAEINKFKDTISRPK